MSTALTFKYYQGEEADLYSFYRIPKALFTNVLFKNVSVEAKILYGLMLDRMGLSARNRWLDSFGRVYIFFTLDDAVDIMGFGHNKVVRLFRELEEIGLIERKKQGQGKPTMIYVKSFVLSQEAEEAEPNNVTAQDRGGETSGSGKPYAASDNNCAQPREKERFGEMQTSKDGKSAILKTGGLDFSKEAGNKNNINKNEKNNTDNRIYLSTTLCSGRSRIDGTDGNRWMDDYRVQIKENIDYDLLKEMRPYDMERINGYVELMAEACCSGKNAVRVNQESIPVEQVKKRLLSLNREHILYVLECMGKTTTKIKNIRAYVLSALYNAPVTMEQYYSAMVNHDMENYA